MGVRRVALRMTVLLILIVLLLTDTLEAEPGGPNYRNKRLMEAQSGQELVRRIMGESSDTYQGENGKGNGELLENSAESEKLFTEDGSDSEIDGGGSSDDGSRKEINGAGSSEEGLKNDENGAGSSDDGSMKEGYEVWSRDYGSNINGNFENFGIFE